MSLGLRSLERGSGVVSFVVLAPMMVILTLAVVQAGICAHGRHSATLAAATALNQASAYQADIDWISQQTQAELTAASGWLEDIEIDVKQSRDHPEPAEVSVQVRAKAFKVLPWGTYQIVVQDSKVIEQPQR